MAAICKGTSGAIVGVQQTRGRAGSLARFVWTWLDSVSDRTIFHRKNWRKIEADVGKIFGECGFRIESSFENVSLKEWS